MNNDLYEELQVSPTAEPEVIEVAFRRLARKYHPDVSGDPNASERMQRLAYAHAVLSDRQRRAAYDRTRRDRSLSGATRATGGGWWPRLSRGQVVIALVAAVLVVLALLFVPATRPLLARGLAIAAVVSLVLWFAYVLRTRL